MMASKAGKRLPPVFAQHSDGQHQDQFPLEKVELVRDVGRVAEVTQGRDEQRQAGQVKPAPALDVLAAQEGVIHHGLVGLGVATDVFHEVWVRRWERKPRQISPAGARRRRGR